MVKKFLFFLIVLLLVVNVLGTQNPFQGTKDETYYMVTFLSGISFWKACFSGFEAAADMLGVTAVYTGHPTFDINGEVTVFNQVAAKNPAGIAVTAVNPDAFVKPINEAVNNGIPVVTFDSDSPSSKRYSFIGVGNKNAGAAAAHFVAEVLNGKGEVALLYSIGQGNVEQRVQGFLETIESSYPDIKVVAKVNDGGDQLTATKNMSATLQAHPEIDMIFCVDGVAGVGGAQAVKETNNVGKVKILAFDVDPAVISYVKSGIIEGTVVQGMSAMGFWSMMTLYLLHHNLVPEAYIPSFIDSGVIIATKENIDEILDSQGLTPMGLPKKK
ncbi:MAG: substrate-binding domain-containing protein [Thermosipho sp. (in: Bacteria)]|nr:substrate-binding domain-containing protein [Thermosipho sp. (in: thermotogales)]